MIGIIKATAHFARDFVVGNHKAIIKVKNAALEACFTQSADAGSQSFGKLSVIASNLLLELSFAFRYYTPCER